MSSVNGGSPTTAAELREVWKGYWTGRGHSLVGSSSLIPTHPSAPMFTNAGMLQFVPYFLGEERAPFTPPRATSIQKCVRAGGKHNDLDAIGRSLRHLSFFEMLGNFSFGDYFKHEAIVWAWEFTTQTLGIDGDRIWATVHTTDDEAEEIWHKEVGLPRERIQRLDKDNFWEMGETGPCGPSSELFYDFGPEHGPDGRPANPAAESRFIEFWNLVFMQYFRDASGGLSPQDNQGITAALDSPGAVVPHSVADYIAQVYHDAPCTKTSCTGSPPCKPTGSQNRFGCDEHGALGLGEVDGDAPLQPGRRPLLPAPRARSAPRSRQPSYTVVRYAAAATRIPAYLRPFFDPAKASPPGISCTSVGRNQDKRYGLQPPPWPPGSRRSGNLPGCASPITSRH
jgi:hypothetical protein